MTFSQSILAQLQTAAGVPALGNYSLAGESSFGIGGPARYFCAPTTADGLRAGLNVAHKHSLPWFVLGGGSNVLFRDEGFAGLVLSTKNLRRLDIDARGLVHAGPGLPNADLTTATIARALTGFEWAAGLPGSVGGGVTMNAKCYGGVFADIVTSVQALRPDGTVVNLEKEACGFGYKDSIFQREKLIITEVVMRLKPGDAKAIRAASEANIADRQTKGQFYLPSAGCVFKNDYAVCIPSGRLIEECGLKGTRIGGAKISEKHANFIVNTGTATAQDVLALIELIKQTVWDKKQVRLEEELRIVP